MWRECSEGYRSTQHKAGAMNTFTVLLILSIALAHAIIPDTPANLIEYNVTIDNYNTKTEMLIEEKIKEARIQMVKYQILSILNLKEAAPSVQKPSEASQEIIKLLIKEEEELKKKRDQLINNEERLVIHAKKSNLRCLYTNTTYCKMHIFDLSQPLNTSSMYLLVYKLTTYPKYISITLSSPASSLHKRHEVLYYEVQRAGWNKLQFPDVFIPPSWNESSYTVEIIGENIDYIGELRPVLLASKSPLIHSRNKREATCDSNGSCCWKPFRVSFADIGFKWIVYPSEIDINYCSGKCSNDPSTIGTHYEIAMLKLLENDNTLKGSLGECWTFCCKPKEFDSVRVLYNDTNGIIHDQFIHGVSVKSCGCT